MSGNLEGNQRRAARFVIHDYSRFTSVSSLLKDLNWAPLKDRRRDIQDIRLAMLFKIVKCNMPVQADDILLPADHNHNHNHELCSAPFTIKPTDQRCITVKVLSLHTQHKHIH